MRGRLAVAALIVLSGAPDSRAEPAPAAPPADLRARRLPFVPTLAMRVATTAAPRPSPTAAAATPPAADPLRFERSTPQARPSLTSSERFARLAEKVRAQLTLGLGVDGAEPTARALTVAGNALTTPAEDTLTDDDYLRRIGYARARAYAFGDAVLGVDGVGVAGISTFIAAQFRITPSRPAIAPVATAWDELDQLHVRAGWAEADGVFERGLLAPLVLRGGRQFIEGPATAHVDGLWASWSRGGVRLAAYFGARVPDWYQPDGRYPGSRAQRGLVSGGEVSADLRRFRLPFQVRLRALAFENHGHSDATVDWNARRDLVATGNVRLFDGAIVREHVTVRYRVSDETRLVVDGDVRQRGYPVWDYAFYAPDETQVARRYLDLGPSIPRVAARARAGTVVLDNVDVLLHGGFALDARLEADELSYQAAGWFETGAAFEIRVRRTLAVGLSGLARSYRHRDPPAATIDVEDVAQPLELQPRHLGERNLFEGGVSTRFSGGARKFSASAEIYARRTKFAERYRNDDEVHADGPIGTGDNEAFAVLEPIDVRGGGRFVFEAWVTPNLRMRAEYDLSSTLDAAPEILGLKQLRVLAEGSF